MSENNPTVKEERKGIKVAKADLTGDLILQFEAVKRKRGIPTDGELIRLLILEEYRRLQLP